MPVEEKITNEILAHTVLQTAIDCGVEEFCICPGARNAPLLASIATQDFLKCYWGFEERSTSFFALGRIKRTNKPVAVIVTSGTAVAEVLPAVMEAYYTSLPLLLITADRPSRFRGKGAPQSCDQHDLFGIYAPFKEDIEDRPFSGLLTWDQRSPAHINVCFEEPIDTPGKPLRKSSRHTPVELPMCDPSLDAFLHRTTYPLVIVGELAARDQDAVEEFLLRLNAPVICEPPSGLSYRTSLSSIRLRRRKKILETAMQQGYPIDGVIRIGGVPTLRLWRDLENMRGKIPVISLSRHPFPGLSFGEVTALPISPFFENYNPPVRITPSLVEPKLDQILETLYEQFPRAEQTMFYQLSKKMDKNGTLYLGNSLPIREWDQFAYNHFEDLSIAVNRGLNGIDGQLSTALGFGAKNTINWVILGDLTTLYDLAAPWFLSQMRENNYQIVVVNNSGGQIFSDMFKNRSFLNQHSIRFNSFAQMWGLDYAEWTTIPSEVTSDKSRIIELIPDAAQTEEFKKAMKNEGI